MSERTDDDVWERPIPTDTIRTLIAHMEVLSVDEREVRVRGFDHQTENRMIFPRSKWAALRAYGQVVRRG